MSCLNEKTTIFSSNASMLASNKSDEYSHETPIIECVDDHHKTYVFVTSLAYYRIATARIHGDVDYKNRGNFWTRLDSNVSETMETCLLCLEKIKNNSIDNVKVNSAQWQEMQIENLINKYFWPLQTIQISALLCKTCWKQLNDFHKFYELVKEAHENLKSSIKTEKETGGQEEYLKEEEQDQEFLWNDDDNDISVVDTFCVVPVQVAAMYMSDPEQADKELQRTATLKESNNDSGNCATTTINKEPVPEKANKTQHHDPINAIVKQTSSKTEGLQIKIRKCNTNKKPKTQKAVPSKGKVLIEPKDCNTRERAVKRKVLSVNISNEKANTPKVFTSKRIVLSDIQVSTASKKTKTQKADLDATTAENSFDSNSAFKSLKKIDIEELKNLRNKDIDEFISKNFKLICHLCRRPMKTFKDLSEHFSNEHKKTAYSMCCNQKFVKRYDLFDHLQQHLNPNYFKCKHCDQICMTRIHYRNHKKKHIPRGELRTHICDVCGSSFYERRVLKAHKTVHMTENEKKFSCTECGKKYGTYYMLSAHKRGVHSGPASCDLCGLLCANKKALGVHKSIKHRVDKKQFVCPTCSKICLNKSCYTAHIKNSHRAKCNHKCTMCDKAFKTAVSLRNHVATHTGTPLYFCQWCPKTFKSSSNKAFHSRKCHRWEYEE